MVRSDVFQYLRRTEKLYDVIILDPPAFAKTKRDVKGACRGYKDIHLQAMRRLRTDGLWFPSPAPTLSMWTSSKRSSSEPPGTWAVRCGCSNSLGRGRTIPQAWPTGRGVT